jgi:hypothetical protein
VRAIFADPWPEDVLSSYLLCIARRLLSAPAAASYLLGCAAAVATVAPSRVRQEQLHAMWDVCLRSVRAPKGLACDSIIAAQLAFPPAAWLHAPGRAPAQACTCIRVLAWPPQTTAGLAFLHSLVCRAPQHQRACLHDCATYCVCVLCACRANNTGVKLAGLQSALAVMGAPTPAIAAPPSAASPEVKALASKEEAAMVALSRCVCALLSLLVFLGIPWAVLGFLGLLYPNEGCASPSLSCCSSQ